MIDLSPTQAATRVTALLAAHESRTLDFKRISAKHGRMIETICAFANTAGGIVAIGVADVKDLKPGAKPETRLFAVEENLEAFDDLRRQVMQRFAPPLSSEKFNFIIQVLRIMKLKMAKSPYLSTIYRQLHYLKLWFYPWKSGKRRTPSTA